MKKIILFCIFSFLTIFISFSQTSQGIGTTLPNRNAVLDVVSSGGDKGLLIPRVSSLMSGLGSSEKGLIVFNITSNTFHIWNGTAWQLVATGGSSSWDLSGNSGTNSNSNFIGTFDDRDLVFRSKNIEAMRIDSATQYLLLGGSSVAAFARLTSISGNDRSGFFRNNTSIGGLPAIYIDNIGSGSALNAFSNDDNTISVLNFGASTSKSGIQTESSSPNGYGLKAINSSSGAGNKTALWATSTNGRAIFAQGVTSGIDASASSTSGVAINASANGASAIGLNATGGQYAIQATPNSGATAGIFANIPDGNTTPNAIYASSGNSAFASYRGFANKGSNAYFTRNGSAPTNPNVVFENTSTTTDSSAVLKLDNQRTSTPGTLLDGFKSSQRVFRLNNNGDILSLGSVRFVGLTTGGSPTSTVVADALGNLSVVAGTPTFDWGLFGNASTVSNNNFIGTTDAISLRLRTNNLERMVIDSVGNVAIGGKKAGRLAGATRILTVAGTESVSNNTAAIELVGNTNSLNTMASKIDFLGVNVLNATIERARIEARSGASATGAGQLAFYVNDGTSTSSIIERMRIASSGNVGIGTVTPNALLHVSKSFGLSSNDGALIDIQNISGTLGSLSGFRFKNNSSTSNDRYGAAIFHRTLSGDPDYQLNFAVKDNSNASNVSTTDIKMTIMVDGSVGIGTITPTQKLTIRDTSRVLDASNGAFIDINNNLTLTTGITSGIRFKNRADNTNNYYKSGVGFQSSLGFGRGNLVFFNNNNTTFSNFTDADIRMLINPSGQVGIGTSTFYNSSTLLQVGDGTTSATSIVINSLSTGTASGLAFQSSGVYKATVGYSPVVGQDYVYIYEGGITSFVSKGGLIGINTQSPSERLEVVGNIEIPAANEYKYATAKTKYLSIPAAAFSTKGGTASGVAVYSTTGSNVNLDGSGGSIIGYLVAPLTSLPDGATITSMDVRLYDNSSTGGENVTVNLYRLLNGTGTATSLGNISSVTTTISLQKLTTAVNSTIDYSSYNYTIAVTMGNTSANALYNVQLTYTVNNAD